MKLPIWYKTEGGKWIHLTHFPDGQIGLTMKQAVTLKLNDGPGTGMGKLPIGIWTHVWDTGNHSRFLLIKKSEETT